MTFDSILLRLLPIFIPGVVFVLLGYIQLKFPPKKINPLFGYRTVTSMKNITLWNYAQKISSSMMIKIGGIDCILGCIVGVSTENSVFPVAFCLISTIASVVALLIMTESSLRQFESTLVKTDDKN